MNKVYLWEHDVPIYNNKIEQEKPNVRLFLKDGAKSLVVICPGGGYEMKAFQHEGYDIAEYFNSLNISAMVLDYRVTPYMYPAPQFDAKRAIRFARFYADKYGYDKDKIGIMGFSAGGHLAACLGTIWDDFEYDIKDEIDKESGRPDFMILCYPVISFVNNAHLNSRFILIGHEQNRFAESLSLETRVTKDTPPTFIWHTADDEGVPVENSLNLAVSLSKCQVPYEMHIYKSGEHGIGLANGINCELNKDVSRWSEDLEVWLKDMKYTN